MLLFTSVDPNDQKKTACYDIDVEVDDTLKTQMNSFLLSTASQQEIAGLDNKVCKSTLVTIIYSSSIVYIVIYSNVCRQALNKELDYSFQ